MITLSVIFRGDDDTSFRTHRLRLLSQQLVGRDDHEPPDDPRPPRPLDAPLDAPRDSPPPPALPALPALPSCSPVLPVLGYPRSTSLQHDEFSQACQQQTIRSVLLIVSSARNAMHHGKFMTLYECLRSDVAEHLIACICCTGWVCNIIPEVGLYSPHASLQTSDVRFVSTEQYIVEVDEDCRRTCQIILHLTTMLSVDDDVVSATTGG